MKRTIIIALLLGTFTFISCGSDSDDNITTELPVTGAITYTTHVAPIFASNCIGCHGATPANGATTSMNTYATVRAAVEVRTALTRINDGTMPPSGKLPAATIAVIEQWKAGGYLQ